jgi:hypothetical protein
MRKAEEIAAEEARRLRQTHSRDDGIRGGGASPGQQQQQQQASPSKARSPAPRRSPARTPPRSTDNRPAQLTTVQRSSRSSSPPPASASASPIAGRTTSGSVGKNLAAARQELERQALVRQPPTAQPAGRPSLALDPTADQRSSGCGHGRAGLGCAVPRAAPSSASDRQRACRAWCVRLLHGVPPHAGTIGGAGPASRAGSARGRCLLRALGPLPALHTRHHAAARPPPGQRARVCAPHGVGTGIGIGITLGGGGRGRELLPRHHVSVCVCDGIHR